jgi:hypothetical protein
MSNITTRVLSDPSATLKNAPLSNAEIDTNFINLNNEKVETADAVSTNTANKVVKRDASGNFAANQVTVAGIVTGAVTYPTTNVTQAQMEAGTDTTTRYMSASNVKQAIDVLAMQTVGNVTKDMTGFESIAGSTINYVDATRVFTLGTSSSYTVWYRGKKSVISSNLTITLPATPGNHYIGINPTSLVLERLTDESNIFSETILVASIYLDTATTKALIVGDERHSSARDTTWHASQHNALGAIWRSGGSMSYTLDNDSATTVSFVSPIVLADEDLVHTISHSSSPSGYFQQTLTGTAVIPTLYLNGTTYSEASNSSTPWVAGTSTARINQINAGSGSLTDAGEGKYLNYWIVATNDVVRPIKAIMGRVAYNTKSEAYAEQFSPYGLPFLECAPMYQVTLLTQGAFAGNKVRLVNVRTIYDSQGAISQSNAVTVHSTLASLGSDDHTQYVHVSTARTITANHTFSGNNTFSGTNGFNRITVSDIASNFVPASNAAYDLGSTTNAWRNVYTNDLHLSNEGHDEGNVVDGTKGNWTVQEGSEHLYIINNKTGKKYKFKLEEV